MKSETYEMRFQKQVADPIGIMHSATKLADAILKNSTRNNQDNIEIYSDINKIMKAVSSPIPYDLIELNICLTKKYAHIIEHSGGDLVIVPLEVVNAMTYDENKFVLAVLGKKLSEQIQSNNFNNVTKSMIEVGCVIGEHFAWSAIKALDK